MAEPAPPRRQGRRCSSQRIDTHGIIKEQTDTHTHTPQPRVCVWWTHRCFWLLRFQKALCWPSDSHGQLTLKSPPIWSRYLTGIPHYGGPYKIDLYPSCLQQRWLFRQGLWMRVTSHAEAASREPQVSRCTHLTWVAPMETSRCLEAIFFFSQLNIWFFLFYVAALLSTFVIPNSCPPHFFLLLFRLHSAGCKGKKWVSIVHIWKRLSIFPL